MFFILTDPKWYPARQSLRLDPSGFVVFCLGLMQSDCWILFRLICGGLSPFSESKCLRDEEILQTLPVGTTASFYFSDLGAQLTWGTVSTVLWLRYVRLESKHVLLPPACPSRNASTNNLRKTDCLARSSVRSFSGRDSTPTVILLWQSEETASFAKKKNLQSLQIKLASPLILVILCPPPKGNLLWLVFPAPLHPFVLCSRTYNLMAPFLPKVFIPLTSHLSFTAPHYSTLPTHSLFPGLAILPPIPTTTTPPHQCPAKVQIATEACSGPGSGLTGGTLNRSSVQGADSGIAFISIRAASLNHLICGEPVL